MFVHINRSLNVSLESPDDLKRFSVKVDASRDDLNCVQDAARVAGELVDADTMWVSQAWLRGVSNYADDAVWQDGVSAMIEFARKHGWVRDGSNDIRAHVVWAPPT
jgi:hypothetical protein